ncbi:unnamed protein product [Colias eurytheme]|nr:unnamed protein product [Colias eurytheme]
MPAAKVSLHATADVTVTSRESWKRTMVLATGTVAVHVEQVRGNQAVDLKQSPSPGVVEYNVAPIFLPLVVIPALDSREDVLEQTT